MELDRRQTGTVLAALRFYQAKGLGRLPLDMEQIATEDGAFEAMNAEEIDDLCIAINCDPPAWPPTGTYMQWLDMGAQGAHKGKGWRLINCADKKVLAEAPTKEKLRENYEKS